MADGRLRVAIASGHPFWRGRVGFVRGVLREAAFHEGRGGRVSVLLADDAALRVLNAQWRGKDRATNVLSFPAVAGGDLWGDIALAAETIRGEAKEQSKTEEAHIAHLLVHGFLHLLGYDHENPADAAAMEARECAILAKLGYNDPYEIIEAASS